MNPETARAFDAWLPEHIKAFKDLGWPEADDDKIGVRAELCRRLVRDGITDRDILFEITRRMVLSGDRLFTIQDHIKQILIVGRSIVRNRQAEATRLRPAGDGKDALVERIGRILEWFRGQTDEFREEWRREATKGMEWVRNHKLCDDFVCGVIAARHPEFAGDVAEATP